MNFRISKKRASDLASRAMTVLLVLLAGWTVLPMFGFIHTGSHLEKGAQPGELVFKAVPDGRELRLSSFRGRPLVLTFFSTSCPACRLELPDLEELSQKLAGRASFLVVSGDDPATLQEYWKSRGLTLPLAWEAGAASSALRVSRIPYSVILDAAGRVHADFIGGVRARDLPL